MAARLLARRTHRWLTGWRRRSGNDEARLVLVAHSMGGLVARAFLELLDGWRTTRALVAFGTPFRGSPNALDALSPVVGIGQTTPQSARLVDGRLEVVPSWRGEDHSGDGTVPRASATPLEKGHEGREMHAGTRHAVLQSAGATLTHVAGLLAGLDIDLDAYRMARARVTHTPSVRYHPPHVDAHERHRP